MANFAPIPKIDSIYLDQSGKRFRVININGDEVDVLRLKEDGTPDSSLISWKDTKWNSRKMKPEESISDGPRESNSNGNKLGEDPELPPIFFAYDPVTKRFEVKDRRGNVITGFDIMTVNGKDGDSAYQLWKNGQKPGTDVSFEAFLKAFRGAKGEMGIQGPAGPQGEQGDIWMPIISTDGENLYFRNSKGEETNRFPIKGVKGDQGIQGAPGKDGVNGLSAFEEWKSLLPEERRNATLSDFFSWLVKQTEEKIDAKEGATWVPNFVDGKIVFQNNRTKAVSDAYIVKGKDGKSFIPKIIDEKLTFVDDNGNEVIPRHDFRGKSAFELWQEQPENEGKTLKDFFDFLKGEKGDQGLDGIVREAKHSYLDIKDHVCPVQKIDTSLLVNVSDSAKSPEAIVDERINEINEKREAGKNERASRFKEFFWWCAGADRALLRKCPGDHSKYVGIGSVILFTALMAWFSSFIAMKLVFETQSLFGHPFPIWAALFATFWASMIFFLDRFITNTMYSDGEVTISKDEFIGGLPRILIAIFLGIVISAPLELKIFEDEIATLLKHDLIEEYQNKEVDKSDILASLENEVKEWEEEVEKAEINVEFFTNPDRSGNAYDQYYGKIDRIAEAGSESTSKGQPIWNPETKSYERNDIKIKTGPSYKRVRNDNKFYEKKFEADHEKAKLILNRAKDSLAFYRKKNLETKINLINSFNVDSAYQKLGLYEQLDAMHRIALNEGKKDEFKPIDRESHFWEIFWVAVSGAFLTGLIWWLFTVDKWTSKKIVSCIIFSLLVGVVIFFGCNTFYEIAYYLSTPIGLIMLLFILIDISPVLYKMMLADGVYDKYLQQEKQLKQSKIRISLARMIRLIDKSELKALSPFIMGDFYNEMKELNIDCSNDDSGDIKWGTNADALDSILADENKKLFNTVLEYKKRIILASYSAWYRDMRDALIGTPDDPNGEKISPEEVLLNDTSFDNINQTTKE